MIGTSASIVNAYSSYFDYNGIYFGTLQAYDELRDGWLFKNRLMDSRDDGYRRFRWMIKAGLPVWLLVITFTKRMVLTGLIFTGFFFPSVDIALRMAYSFWLLYAIYQIWGVGENN